MKRKIFLFVFLFSASTLFASLETSLMKTAIDFATKPENFFMDLATSIENSTPTAFNKRFQLNTSLLWDLITVGNIQAKYRVYPGDSIIPEITPGLMYWNILGLSLLPEEDVSASASGFTPFLTLARQFEEDLKFFAGVKFVIARVDLNIKNIADTDTSGTGLSLSSLSSIKAKMNELGVYIGINYLRPSGKEVLALVGYYPDMKKLYAKAQISSTVFDYGLSFYPDSSYLLDVFINIHINL